jgi:predicted N-acetyltransferase YhbS
LPFLGEIELEIAIRLEQPEDHPQIREVNEATFGRHDERFGFSSQSARHLSSPFPPDAFMALELVEDALAEVRGAVRYAAAFGL